MLKHGEPNPLNVFGLRQINHCPPHFERVLFDLSFMGDKPIIDWIYENLEGRFYTGTVDVAKSPGGKMLDRQYLVAFELSAEASYFSLFLPQILNSNTPNW